MRLGVFTAIAAIASALLALATGGGVGAATTVAQPSVRVAVIPGFNAPVYPGTYGVPKFPITSPSLASYQFTEISAPFVTAASLKSYDTVVVYGQRWMDLPTAAQSAISTFARTGKVLIWDSDGTGAQSYSSFIHPFSTTSSGEYGSKTGSVVSYPSGDNPFASSNSSSRAYLSPAALTSDNHLIAHMNVMNAGLPDWAPSLVAANAEIPHGGWVLAWGYGVTGDHSGMVVYSGLDADAFTDSGTNWALKELAVELAQPFLRSADSTCAPNCKSPVFSLNGATAGSGGGGSGGSGGGGGGTAGGGDAGGRGGGGTVFASCSLMKRAPAAWVHGHVSLLLKTSVAAGLTVRAETTGGKTLGASVVPLKGRAKLDIDTHLLPSNKMSSLRGIVYVNGVKACAVGTALKVDNVPPRVLSLAIRGTSPHSTLVVRASEHVRVMLRRLGRAVSPSRRGGPRAISIPLPSKARSAVMLLVDRAGNSTTRRITWR